MSAKRKRLIAIAAVVTAVLGLMVIVWRGSPANYWITPAELAGRAGAADQDVRVAGQLVHNTLDWDGANNRMVFKIKAPGEKTVLQVAYPGIAPDALVNDSRVIVEGSLNGKWFNARTLLIRCPENYLAERAVVGLFKTMSIEGALYR